MKLTITLLTLMLSAHVYAATNAVISSNEQTAHVIVQGADDDAKKIYDSLNVTPTQSGSVNKKEIASTAGDFKLTCSSSALTTQTSCTLTVLAGASSLISYNDKIVKFVLVGSEAEALYKQFFVTNGEYIFESSDSNLLIKVEKSAFGISFRQKKSGAIINPRLLNPDDNLEQCLKNEVEKQSAVSLGKSLVSISGPFYKNGTTSTPDTTIAQYVIITEKPSNGNPRTVYIIELAISDPTEWQLFTYGFGQIGMYANKMSTLSKFYRKIGNVFEMTLDLTNCANHIGQLQN